MGTHRPGDPTYELLPPGSDVHSKPATALSVSALALDFAGISTSFSSRWHGRRLARRIEELTEGQRISAEYAVSATANEQAKQGLELAQRQAALIPLKIERERQQLQGQLLEGQVVLSAILQRHQNEAELAAADHELALLERRERKLTLKARIKAKKRELRGPKDEQPADDGTTDAFRRHYKTETRVRANRSEADVRIAAIYARAQAERRNLSDDEIEEVDALTDAAEAAEADVRRGAAGGF